MTNIRILIISIFLLLWQIYIPVHNECSSVEHIENINMSCCSGDEECNCCCSHDFETSDKTECSQCKIIDIDINSKVFELNNKYWDFSLTEPTSTLKIWDSEFKKFDIIISDRIHTKEKPYLMISALLI